ncbi:hypothetical protein ACFV9C_42970 [Kribbella sp. NPDC059898]|uniref:hypothetical protein n=1 Tax=Kribbella sp. NPDC059898 TaxID=3346995 RepID=UPI00364C4B69
MSNNGVIRRAAQNALHAYRASAGISAANEIDTSIADLIADLMHLADRRGYDGAEVAERAIDYYNDEQDA